MKEEIYYCVNYMYKQGVTITSKTNSDFVQYKMSDLDDFIWALKCLVSFDLKHMKSKFHESLKELQVS